MGLIMNKTMLIAGVALCTLAGCNTVQTTRFQAAANQQAMVRDGRPAIVSKKPKSIVLVSPAARVEQGGARTAFVVGITNISRAPIDFKVESVSVYQTKDGQIVQPLKVITYEQLVQEEKTRQVVSALLVGVAAAGNAYSASQAGRGYASANVYTPRGGVYHVSGTYYDPTAAAIAQSNASAQNAAMIANTVEAGQRNMAALEQAVVKDNTLLPGEWYGGQLHFQAPTVESHDSPKSFTIGIKIGDEVHEIDVVQEVKSTS